jgi:hypothetical protein
VRPPDLFPGDLVMFLPLMKSVGSAADNCYADPQGSVTRTQPVSALSDKVPYLVLASVVVNDIYRKRCLAIWDPVAERVGWKMEAWFERVR